jgi:diguanylate cyclase (GGDEF)-like protein
VYGADKTLAGVMATDVTLKMLTDFLRTLEVSRNGVAFVVDEEGFIIASSGQEMPFKMANSVPERMRAEEMKTQLIRDAYAQISGWKNGAAPLTSLLTSQFSTQSGTVEMAAARLGQKYGVNWLTVVAVPQADFMEGVTRSLYQGVSIAGICVITALVLGLANLNRVLSDIRTLTHAVQKVGNGEPLPALNIRRRDEIGQLAQTFSEMEHNLRIDKLTAVFNRESLHSQIYFLQRQATQEASGQSGFALLFIDLDNFKKINDQHGHDAGDQVLVTVAARLKEAVRISDVVARYGGDEFVVLLKGVIAVDDVIAADEKIRAVVEEPIMLDHSAVKVGVSLGWALFPHDGQDCKALLKVADIRMFEAKKNRKAIR